MRVIDLINTLKTLAQDSEVMVQGYEDGYDDILNVKMVSVVKHPEENEDWWTGAFEDADATNKDAVKVAVIFGSRR